MRELDWTKTELGSPSEWPEHLRVALSICLTSRLPMLICWGRHLALLYNDAFIPFLGHARHPIALAKPAPEALAEVWKTIGPIVERGLQTGDATWADDVLMSFEGNQRRDVVHATFSCSPLLGPAGVADGIFCACSKAGVRLDAPSSLASDGFLAVLGHELRNPLAPITTAISLMHRQNIRVHELEVIERQTRRLARIVDDLLDISHVASGKVELQKQRVELADVLAVALEMTSDVLQRGKHVVNLNLLSEGLPVEGDPGRLAQVFSNILGNAAKYSEPGSRIEVDGMKVGDCARLIIRDFGMGLSPKLRSRIFEMSVQQSQALDRSAGGLGLGLAIARGVVQMHGGTITANSEGVGKGSEFVVDLPIAKQAPTPVDELDLPMPAAQPTKSTDEKRILVVDDNQDAADLYATVLARAGYDVKTSFDAATALATARQFLPHICVLDIGLPGMNGYEVGALMRERIRRDMRLIAVTGYGQTSDKKRSAEAGFETHLTKPVDVDELLAALEARPPLDAAKQDRKRVRGPREPSPAPRAGRRAMKPGTFRTRTRSA